MQKYLLFLVFLLAPLASHGAQVACTMEYAPVCGEKQVQCIMAPCNPVRQTYSNSCMAGADGATVIFTGDCNIAETIPTPIGGSKDTHGCLVGAGYSWDESMQACVRPWELQPTVDWAYGKGLTKFSSLKEFNYGLSMTRQEAAAFLTRYASGVLMKPEALCKLSYRDMGKIDASLVPAVSRACGMGIMLGHDGYFHPRYALTRAEALVTLMRAIDGKKYDETITPWYSQYKTRAIVLGLSFTENRAFDTPITRGEFIEWMKVLADTKTPTIPNTGLIIRPQTDENLYGDWKMNSYKLGEKMYMGTDMPLSISPDRYVLHICNTLAGSYTTATGVISTQNEVSTAMACSDATLTLMEFGWKINGADYAIFSNRGDPRTWLTITMKDGGVFVFTK